MIFLRSKSTYPWQNAGGAISPGKSATLVNRFMEEVGASTEGGEGEGEIRDLARLIYGYLIYPILRQTIRSRR